MKSPEPQKGGPFFVDATSGALAALAAGVARSLGHADAIAATTSDTIRVPTEVTTVLAEIGAETPAVIRAVELPEGASSLDLARFAGALHEGDGELERLSAARIARDRIECHLTRG
jgi:hypothetical protein